ncbi:MAG: cytochrome c [Betaproteobacteria bacterium]|nr:MAG: cytochrome c [Betaproteobacteria bacterium]
MFTLRTAKWLGVSACAALLAAGCAATQRSGEVPQSAYAGGKLNLGTAPTTAEIAHYFSYPADGRGLPSGSGSYAQGEKVYQTKCLACHGDKLQGTPLGDRLIGGRGTLVNNSPAKAPVKTVESYWPYATSVFDYVKRAMPFNAPGSLSDDEAYAVVAYILGEANIVAKNEVINAGTLARVQMPNRNGFVSPDPRPDVP